MSQYTENTYQTFYKLPRFFYKDERYTPINSKGKLLYAVIFDDFHLAKLYQHKHPNTKYFFDKNNQTYIAPSREKLAQLLNCHKDTITRLKKELIDAGLLRQEYAGNGKPHRLYPLVPKDISNDAKGFFKLPKLLFTDSFYRNMSCEAKILYSVLDSRYLLSVKNDYKDNTGNVCCKFAYSTLANLLKFSSKTIKKLKDELLALGLILQVKDDMSQSLNYYIKTPFVRKEKAEKEENSKTPENLDTQGEQQTESTGSANGKRSGSANGKQSYTTPSYTSNNNTYTNDKSDKYIESESQIKHPNIPNNYQTYIDLEHYKQEQAEKERYLSQYPQSIALALKPYDIKHAQTYMSIICHTKNEHNKSQNTAYTLEDMDMEIARTIDNVKRTMKKNNEKPEDMCSYFKVAMMNCVEEFDIKETLEKLACHFDGQELLESETNMRARKEARMKAKKQEIYKSITHTA